MQVVKSTRAVQGPSHENKRHQQGVVCQRRLLIRLFATATTPADVLSSRGLKPYQIERLERELTNKQAEIPSDNASAWLEERVAGLAAVIGDGDGHLANLIYNGGLELLQKDMTVMASQLVELKEALPGVAVSEVVAKEPRLLWAPDVRKTCEAVVKKLVAIYPYKSQDKRGDVLRVVAEYPELLVRMAYYTGDKYRTVQDLPVDLQNRILRNYC